MMMVRLRIDDRQVKRKGDQGRRKYAAWMRDDDVVAKYSAAVSDSAERTEMEEASKAAAAVIDEYCRANFKNAAGQLTGTTAVTKADIVKHMTARYQLMNKTAQKAFDRVTKQLRGSKYKPQGADY
eukprot:COSAG02_NODE_14497_length_1266_cov_1.074550_2_plen_126_part_00